MTKEEAKALLDTMDLDTPWTDQEARACIYFHALDWGLVAECIRAYEKYLKEMYDPGTAASMALYDWDI